MPTLPLEDDDINEDEHEDTKYNDDAEIYCSDAPSIDSPDREPLEIDENDAVTFEELKVHYIYDSLGTVSTTEFCHL